MRLTFRHAALAAAFALLPGSPASAAPPVLCTTTPLCVPVPTPGNDGRCRATGAYVSTTSTTLVQSNATRANGAIGVTTDEDVLQGVVLTGAVQGYVNGVRTWCEVRWYGTNDGTVCGIATVAEFRLTAAAAATTIAGRDLYTITCADGSGWSTIGSLGVANPSLPPNAIDVSVPENTVLVDIPNVLTLVVHESVDDPAPGGPCPNHHRDALRLRLPLGLGTVAIATVSTAWCVVPQ
jgi:hypothetical protein